ncbi:MAG: hypothetical protein A2268_04400 [Candidatus Raymondbacteria bacterium RifOxyA12_full_50_37]|uniref:Uncharacterized protein n=1 Tax=Candidatus Raymondbacteria bacterium RIFOXYD12_FULL_49_13 TaxID=1817890 RepID=A0A1F7FB05_UNCRA|nr:MAG: hypothetical protein A2268_04400 [Candidatus Raymondbacteria bacterium RifOxyA12_full_50_37]OGJ87720.1 MAG: hypothetical protein A2350_13645 [Candidatus Raymondbacteria bacterium RifOxyB12_full_50_8]OGJ92652.1 MAG: hypothetical protein A2248_05550 [Candidatus Raymondbacteria bacterium RIFOXYA2_FULL_49_16]OGJ98006.1 MAG: hypothetical protein A2453_02575 [Candidatus Raymondbacteria bacterium RIFOXYC2_FULL_50_21]OGK03855.1 MAG: hypothetical protein A2519_02240 [Candidatus Raymondbacteria b
MVEEKVDVVEKINRNETVEAISVNYEENGILLVKEIKKEILSRGAWATVMFLYQEYDRANSSYKPPKISLRRYQKKNGNYIQRSKFSISGEKQAGLISQKISDWYREFGGVVAGGSSDDAEA